MLRIRRKRRLEEDEIKVYTTHHFRHISVAYRGAKVVSHFMCEGDMRDFWRYVGRVVLNSDYTGVERLPLPIRVQLAFFTDSP